MPYTTSSLTLAQIRATVAAASGSEGNTPMETLATRAVQSALQRWSSFWNWAYLKTDGAAIPIYAPVSVTIAAHDLQGPNDVWVRNALLTATVAIGDKLIQSSNGAFLPPVLFVLTCSAQGSDTRLRFTTAPSGSGSAYTVVDNSSAINISIAKPSYALPTPARTIYSLRTVLAPAVLRPIEQRSLDRGAVTDDVGTPSHYSLFNADGVSGKLRIYPLPAANDWVRIRYLREPSIASASGDVLDIPRDAEFCITSLAKGYYLMDKGEEKASFWANAGETALREMRARELQEIDAEPAFTREGSLYPYGQQE